MATAKEIIKYIAYALLFLPVFAFLLLLGAFKIAFIGPYVCLLIAFGDIAILIGLWPCHLFYSIYCIIRTKKFGPFMKCLLVILSPIPILAWTVVGVLGTVTMAVYYAVVWPVMETFKAISREGSSPPIRLLRCFTDGTLSNLWGACTIVRDFADFSFHSYFSVMNGLLESDGEDPIELKVLQIPGCILCAIVGVLIDVIFIPLITIYKAPILLIKGWHRLMQDLIGREGPFLETVCVPFAGLLVLLWPVGVVLAVVGGILSSVGFGCYAAVVAYQEESAKKGLLYAIASVSIFDEYTNDLIYLREGSCFPRPKYREEVNVSSLLPVRGLHERLNTAYMEPRQRTYSEKMKALNARLIWDNFFKGCENVGKELLRKGAITILDLDAWQQNKNNKIVNVGIPACVFLECFLTSIKSDSSGFLLSNNVELTSLNRPEGRVFDWLFEPMRIMKEQLKSLKLEESEELYLQKLCLYSGDTARMDSWDNGGVPPEEEIRKAQLEGISRRLQGFCLTLSRLPTSRRRFIHIVKEIVRESNQIP
ncbi:putative membrane protein At3g27390 [Silene latifolia]|uniref:putative membrane protein At3g27390 n=1 Tax=Silene latifolia TaxID=37657 RepID=UPI003D78524E